MPNKQIDSKNQIWFTKDGATVQIGFTRSFLDSLSECWHILPANMEHFKQKSPLLCVETNDALISIMSPVTGHLIRFDNVAQNFPDHLTEETTVLELNTESNLNRPPPPAAAEFVIGGGDLRAAGRLFAHQIQANVAAQEQMINMNRQWEEVRVNNPPNALPQADWLEPRQPPQPRNPRPVR